MRIAPALSFVVACLASASVHAASLTHTGYLLGPGELPVEGSRTFEFAIFPASGAALWTSGACAIDVAKGYYTVVLGDGGCGAGLPATALDGNHALEVKVEDVTLAPRHTLLPAARAGLADALSAQPALDFLAQPAAPATPPADTHRLYFQGGRLRARNAAGEESTYLEEGAATGLTGPTTLLASARPVQVLNPASATVDLNLPSTDVRAGAAFDLLNAHASNVVVVKAAGGAVVCRVRGGSSVRVIALQDAPNAPAHWRVFPARRQTELGPLVTANPNTVPASFGPLPTSITLAFTADFTARYRVFGNFVAEPGSGPGKSYGLRIAATSGSPVEVYNPHKSTPNPANAAAQYEQGSNSGSTRRPYYVELWVDLVAGQSYAFRLEGAGNGPALVRSDVVDARLVAEQIE